MKRQLTEVDVIRLLRIGFEGESRLADVLQAADKAEMVYEYQGLDLIAKRTVNAGNSWFEFVGDSKWKDALSVCIWIDADQKNEDDSPVRRTAFALFPEKPTRDGTWVTSFVLWGNRGLPEVPYLINDLKDVNIDLLKDWWDEAIYHPGAEAVIAWIERKLEQVHDSRVKKRWQPVIDHIRKSGTN